jgi:hypothetical protein
MFDVTPDGADFWFDAFNVLLFLGAFAVAVGTYGSIRMGSAKERFSNERISANEKETARAIADSDIAKQGAAEANARAVEAQLALEKFKAPRKLSSEQQAAIVGKIRKFSGQKFDMALNAADPEAAALQQTIESMLTLAGWQQVDWRGGDLVFTRAPRPVIGIITLVGVFAQMERDKAPAFEAAAVMLMGSLNLEGIESKAEAGSIPMAENKDVMHIMVGKKP